MTDLAPEYRGTGVFGLLARPEAERVTAHEADRVALAVRGALQGEVVSG